MPMEHFLAKLFESSTGHNLKDAKTPEDIMVLFKGLGFENIPKEITQKLSLLSIPTEHRNSHFQDSLDISEIIDDLVPEELSELEVNELRAASLVHDVGKTGPSEATPEEQLAFVKLFNLDFPYGQMIDGVKINEVSITKALELKVSTGEITVEKAEELVRFVVTACARQENVRAETQVTAESTMGKFWAAHVYWTYDVLKGTNLPKTLIDTASSHHMLEGHDPAGVGFEQITSGMVSLELADKYQAYRIRLLLVDKYQAFLGRSGRTHEETIDIMRARIDGFFKDCPDERISLRDLYLQILEEINQKKDVFAREMDLAGEK